jgi:hypothetical protein
VKVVVTELQPKITSFTVFVLMNNSLIIFSNTRQLSSGGTQNPGTLSGRTELMMHWQYHAPKKSVGVNISASQNEVARNAFWRNGIHF